MGVVDRAGGPLRLVVFILVGLVLLVVVAGGSLWAMDYGVEATIVDKECSTGGGSTVSVQERVSRFVHTESIERQECLFAQEGHVAKYNIRSERLRLFTEDGHCYWDSEGVEDCAVPSTLVRG